MPEPIYHSEALRNIPITPHYVFAWFKAYQEVDKPTSPYELISYDKTMIDRVLSNKKVIPDISRTKWQMKNDHRLSAAKHYAYDTISDAARALVTDSSESVQAETISAESKETIPGINLSIEEAKMLLATSSSVSGHYEQHGVLHTTYKFLRLMFFLPLNLSVSTDQPPHVISRDRNNNLIVSHDFFLTHVKDMHVKDKDMELSNRRYKTNDREPYLLFHEKYLITEKNNAFDTAINEQAFQMKIDDSFFNEVILTRAKKRISLKTPLEFNDLPGLIPCLIDEEFTTLFFKKLKQDRNNDTKKLALKAIRQWAFVGPEWSNDLARINHVAEETIGRSFFKNNLPWAIAAIIFTLAMLALAYVTGGASLIGVALIVSPAVTAKAIAVGYVVITALSLLAVAAVKTLTLVVDAIMDSMVTREQAKKSSLNKPAPLRQTPSPIGVDLNSPSEPPTPSNTSYPSQSPRIQGAFFPPNEEKSEDSASNDQSIQHSILIKSASNRMG